MQYYSKGKRFVPLSREQGNSESFLIPVLNKYYVMKIVTYLAIAVIASGVMFSSCKKDEASPEDKKKAEEFKAFIVSKKFQIQDYYSDKAIDYDEEDTEIKSETNLWPYVSLWIKDDFNIFDVNSGKVTITQNANKIQGNTAEIITKDFSIGADKNGAYFQFLNYQYNPLKYHLVEFTGDHFLVYVDWHSGAKVYTKFHVIP
jgi:hypothetical protein